MTTHGRLLNIASMRLITITTAAVTGTLMVAACGSAHPQASVSAIRALAPASTAGLATTPALARNQTASPAAVTTTENRQLPISVESERQMRAAGNEGPPSSILLPKSCQLAGSAIIAEGRYANGGFVPNVYNRYGDIIVLYVRSAPSPGYPHGMQLAVSDVRESPVLGHPAPWRVRISMSLSAGSPARCVVAAQPTHDGQFAP